MNIMIVTNSAYLAPAHVMLYSLFQQHKEDKIDIYLPYEDLTEQELEELECFVSSFGENKLFPLYVGDDFKRKVKPRNGFNLEIYYRILGIDLLPRDMDRILYLDVDMVIKGSLHKLYETNMQDALFAVCEDIYGIINGFHEANKRRLGIPSEYSYFNSGVMLYNLKPLWKLNEAKHMLDRIYRDYERYEYGDQDVMNEMYYDRLIYVGWDEYNCPPMWCYLNKEKLAEGEIVFANYDDIRELAKNPQQMFVLYQNITRQIYDNAKVIHYLGNTKPWSKTREAAKLYEMFDEAYMQVVKEMCGGEYKYEI